MKTYRKKKIYKQREPDDDESSGLTISFMLKTLWHLLWGGSLSPTYSSTKVALETSQTNVKSRVVEVRPVHKMLHIIDFDEEAKALMTKKLNLDSEASKRGSFTSSMFQKAISSTSSTSSWVHISPIWRNSETDGIIYVGDHHVAQDEADLRRRKITAIVNCTHGPSQLPNFQQNRLNYSSTYYKYLNFQICYWESFIDDSDKSVLG
jgi:hypothetical protein